MTSNEIPHNLNVTMDPWNGLDEINADELGKLLDEPLPAEERTHLRTNEQHIGFDSNSGNTWIYPSNFPCRSYQYSITHAALFRNTLVVLPTGLGKTFIAAVVMYNIYRWYPNGKVIFMAPTRPLVAQQIDACKRIMAFPVQDTVELTGKLQREKRISLWRSKRVFFATPQVVQVDMCGQQEHSTDFPFDQVKLLVIDEAHRARGRYAYTEVVQALWQRNHYFRVLALSATPGRTMEDVADVVRNLFISHLEVRWDTSIDVVPFIHHRSMKTIVVPLSEEIKRVREELVKVIDPYMRQLLDAGVISGSHQHITRNFLIFEQKRFREQSMRQAHPQQAAVTSNFSICISLSHSLELLERHGLRVFLNSFEDDEDGRPKFVLTMNPYLRDLVARVREEVGPNPFDISAHKMTNGKIAEVPKDLDFGHPKFEEARKALLAHFEQNPGSRAIVFCEFRESVMLIHRLLLQHTPILKPRCFVGQGGSTGPLRSLSQKQQIEIMNDFRAGKSNVLIATSIGEEGIDVGEVDLIVCFDMCTSNPTRFIQRIGRTGRQKRGHVVMLVTEGKEQQILKEVLAQKDQTNKKLLRSSVVQSALYRQSPRLVPCEYNPECVKTFMKPAEEEKITPQVFKATKSKKIAKVAQITKAVKSKEKLIESTQDLRKFFKKIETNCDADDVEIFQTPCSTSTAPSEHAQNSDQSMDKMKSLFRHINVAPLTSSNTQLMETQSTPKPAPMTARLESSEIRRINKLLKSNTQGTDAEDNNKNLVKQLQSSNFSHSNKLRLLKHHFVRVREICEKMDILQALELEDDISQEEQEIRETFEAILACFKDRNELERLLDDAQFEAHESAKQAAIKAAEVDEMDMTEDEFTFGLNKVFQGLDEQGNCWDSFDHRQEELLKTSAYKNLLNKALEHIEDDAEYGAQSAVFDAKLSELDQSSFTIMDSKYCSQWEKDFEHSRVINKSTPLHGPLVKAFKQQQNNSQGARKRLETVVEQHGNSSKSSTIVDEAHKVDDDKDVVVLLSSDESNLENDAEILNKQSSYSNKTNTIDREPLEEDLHKLQRAIENSFLLRQQSTPIQHKSVRTKSPTVETSIEYDFDLDLDAFTDPLPEELELINEQQVYSNSGSSTKENMKPIASKATTAVEKVEAKPAPSELFKLLESKPTNSVMTPRCSKTLARHRKDEIPTPKSPEFLAPNFISQLASPPSRTNTAGALKKYETSPSIFTTYTKGLQRMESARRLQSRNLEQSVSNGLQTRIPSAKTNNDTSSSVAQDIDSPIIRKRSEQLNLKRKLLDSSTESEATPTRSTNRRNSDSDFEEIVGTQVSKRRCLSRRRENRLRRARLTSFFDNEAEKSGGSGHSTDDNDEEDGDNSLDNFVCDSVIVADDDHEASVADAPTATQMHAVYLQSVRSPLQRRGCFKIPAPRTYDQHLDIYSQEVPVEPSQYVGDSFVVNEGDATVQRAAETTLCPLERAERILKERKRAAKRRRLAEANGENVVKKRLRKCYQLKDDSDTSDGIG